MFKHLLQRKRGSATERGFTVLEIAVAVGIVLLLSVAGILAYGKIQRNGEIAAVEQAAGQAYTAAMSGAFTAAQIEADASNADITVSVYNLGQPYLFGASGGSGGLGIVGASRIMPAAVEHQEPCVVAEGYDYMATRGACEDIVDGTEPGDVDPGDDGGDGTDPGSNPGGGGVGDDLRQLREVFQLYFTSEEAERFAGQPYTATIKDASGKVLHSESGVASKSGTAEAWYEQKLDYVVKLDGSTVSKDGEPFDPRAYAPTYTVSFDFGPVGLFSEKLKTTASLAAKDDRWFDYTFEQYAEDEWLD